MCVRSNSEHTTNLADVSINVVELLAKLRVVARVLDELVGRIPDDVRAGAVGKAREKIADLAASGVERVITHELVLRVLAVLDDGLSVVSVLLDVADKPPDRLLVVLVLLALDDDLYNTSASECE
jgi:hypothetical protein